MNDLVRAKEVLVVLDDTADLAKLIADIGEKVGFESTATTNVDEFNEALSRQVPDLIVLDLQMPGADGIEVLRQISADGISAQILLVSGMDKRTIDSAQRFGRDCGLNMLGTLQKPFSPEALAQKLSMARDVSRQLTSDELGGAIDDASLQLFFQPVIRRLKRSVWHAESVEALPRWQHPELGWLKPAQFLPLAGADRSDLMRRLTDYVLQKGIEYLRSWQHKGLHLGLRVNVAAGLIRDIDFPDRLDNLIGEYQTDPSLLTLEISDSKDLAESRDGLEILTRLRLKDIHLALDDFGSERQSIRSMYKLPISELKIDRELIGDLSNGDEAAIVISALIDCSRKLGVACCAEGVESQDQLDRLDELGCERAQGYHIGKPVPGMQVPDTVEPWTVDASANRSIGVGS